jgi:hypothetical protein
LAISAQNKFARISLNYGGNIYYLGKDGKGNENIRIGFISAASMTMLDSGKRKGLIIEMLAVRSAAMYPNVLSNNTIVKVKDTYINYSFIYPLIIKLRAKTEQLFGIGLGVSILGIRRYYDQNGHLLDYNNSSLPKLKDGKYWGGIATCYYQVARRISKRIYIELGSRLYTSTCNKTSGYRYEINQGTGIILNGGLSYRLLNVKRQRFSQYKDL